MKNHGFSLIEVLVAFAILSIVIVTGLRILGDGSRRIQQMEVRTAEIAAAREAMDLIDSPSLITQPIPGESVKWTEYAPELRQVRHGDQIVLETIVLERRKK